MNPSFLFARGIGHVIMLAQKVHDYCSTILYAIKDLSLPEITEEQLLAGAKVTATTTYTLVKGIEAHSGKTDFEDFTQLLEKVIELRATIILYIKHRKDLFLNNADYDASKGLKTTRSQLGILVKDVIRLSKEFSVFEEGVAAKRKEKAEHVYGSAIQAFSTLASINSLLEQRDFNTFRDAIKYIFPFYVILTQ